MERKPRSCHIQSTKNYMAPQIFNKIGQIGTMINCARPFGVSIRRIAPFEMRILRSDAMKVEMFL